MAGGTSSSSKPPIATPTPGAPASGPFPPTAPHPPAPSPTPRTPTPPPPSPPTAPGAAPAYAFSPASRTSPLVPNTDGFVAPPTNNAVLEAAVAGGEPRRLTTNPGNDHSPRYSPDGSALAYLSMARAGYESD